MVFFSSHCHLTSQPSLEANKPTATHLASGNVLFELQQQQTQLLFKP
jgi:hypothetical protein